MVSMRSKAGEARSFMRKPRFFSVLVALGSLFWSVTAWLLSVPTSSFAVPSTWAVYADGPRTALRYPPVQDTQRTVDDASGHIGFDDEAADDLWTAIRAIVAAQAEVSDEFVKPTALLEAELGVDSLDIVEIIMASEEAFGIEIADSEWKALQSVKDLTNLIQQKLGFPSAASAVASVR
eukprot:TRINITY_DN32429_c0_g1_i1.p1 TRINITY_DN32429_c0_g1~~TRINITY_DN32429_c0_g1_i1.p1  ORF type:complete len:179 (+),score=27.78 TRINITY_DN32429_c0_g1_i1:81-617(+)